MDPCSKDAEALESVHDKNKGAQALCRMTNRRAVKDAFLTGGFRQMGSL